MADASLETPSPLFERLLASMSPDVRQSLSEKQHRGLRDAFATETWRRQSVDIRLSLPFIGPGYFLTIVAGRERRRANRRRAERLFHPLRTAGNFMFFGGISAVLLITIAAAMLIYHKMFG
jgi:hypothetical protein